MLKTVLLALGFASMKLVSGLPTTMPSTNPVPLKERTVSQPSITDDIKKREPLFPWFVEGNFELKTSDSTTMSDDLQKREPVPPRFYVGNIEQAKSDTAGTADDLDKREPFLDGIMLVMLRRIVPSPPSQLKISRKEKRFPFCVC